MTLAVVVVSANAVVVAANVVVVPANVVMRFRVRIRLMYLLCICKWEMQKPVSQKNCVIWICGGCERVLTNHYHWFFVLLLL